MTNQKRLEEYLVGVNGYLKSDISNGKVIMLSGKWGSGKTHFWQNKIQTVLNDKDKKIPNHYISLYGKTSIQEIKNEVFLKIFEGMDIFKIDDKSVKLAKNTANLVADLTKTVSVFGVNLDLSKIVDKSFEKLEKVREEQKEEKTKALLNSGAIICFDDFERKSKDIDLNDLFGFITNLTIEFKSKVVIILNDDVFEGEEKKIFSNVKEKSVSKFLKYEPKIEELFNLIFDLEIEKDDKKEKRYKKLEPYKQIILKTIEKTQELNARIYIQVLDNLVEWIEKNQEKNNDILRCLVLVNINFILNHYIFYYDNADKNWFLPRIFKEKNITVGLLNKINKFSIKSNRETYNHKFELVDILKQISKNKDYNEIKNKEELNSVDLNSDLIWQFWKFEIILKYRQNVDDNILQKINNFIETGILINE
ncbi:MAG: hypothetical protein U5K55_03105 [Aliarcobacter sp.]|nr:hypothetical protein [Aliarcobacter sp.]